MSIQPRLSVPDRAGSAVVRSAPRPGGPAPLLPAAADRLVLCATGPDETGVESVALWWTDLSGEPKAGWLFPRQLAEHDPGVAARLLLAAGHGRPAHRRDSTGWPLLARLADRNGHPRPAATPLDVDELVADVRRRTGQSPAPPAATARRRCPLVAQLLATCAVIGWATRAGAAAKQPGPSPVSRWLQGGLS